MRMLILVAILSSTAIAQTDLGTTQQTNTVSTPLTARTLAQQSVTAMGGSALLLTSDLVAQVEITPPDSSEIKTVNVKMSGTDKARADASDSSHTTLSSGFVANVINDGETQVMSQRALGPEGISFFPFLAIARDLNDPSTEVEPVPLTNPVTLKFHVKRPLKPPFTKERSYEFSADAATGQILSVIFRRYAPGNEKFSVPVEFRFSNFQVINGLTVPMTIAEYIREQLAATIRITKISFNQGLSGSDFAVRSAQ